MQNHMYIIIHIRKDNHDADDSNNDDHVVETHAHDYQLWGIHRHIAYIRGIYVYVC